MPHRKQKSHVPQNASPRAEKQQDWSADGLPIKGPALQTTNYQEIHQNEAEALRSIYGEDFEDIELRRAAWQVRLHVSEQWLESHVNDCSRNPPRSASGFV